MVVFPASDVCLGANDINDIVHVSEPEITGSDQPPMKSGLTTDSILDPVEGNGDAYSVAGSHLTDLSDDRTEPGYAGFMNDVSILVLCETIYS